MTKKELTKLKINAIVNIVVYCFCYIFSIIQGTSMLTAIFFNGEHVFIKAVIFVLAVVGFGFSVYNRDKSVKVYKDAKSQNKI
ncbi:lysozyme [Lactococcus phage PMBT68]|nr:lysozyme [Lactococcus phage P1411]